MDRRLSLLIAAVAILGVAAWVVVGRADEPEPCRPVDGCIAAVTLQLDQLDLIDAELSRTALSARNPSDDLVVAIVGRRSNASERNDRVVLAAISAETGRVEQLLLDRSGRSAVVEALEQSLDGTLIGVAVAIVEDDGSESHEVLVIELATGDVVSAAELPDDSRSCLLAFSADNLRFECAARVYDVASGVLLGDTDDFEPIDIESGWVRMGFRTASGVQADPDRLGDEIRLQVDGERRTFAVASATIENPERGELTFRPDGARLIHHRQSLDSRRAEIIVYRTTDAAVVRRIQRIGAVHDVAWRGADELVTITADFEVVIYEID